MYCHFQPKQSDVLNQHVVFIIYVRHVDPFHKGVPIKPVITVHSVDYPAAASRLLLLWLPIFTKRIVYIAWYVDASVTFYVDAIVIFYMLNGDAYVSNPETQYVDTDVIGDIGCWMEDKR